MKYKCKAIDIVILVFVAVYALFFTGFFYPDTIVASRHLLLWIVRILFLIPGVSILVVLVRVRMGKIGGKQLKSILLYAALLLLVLYPIVNLAYNALTAMRNVSGFHPYLQLKPNDFVYNTADTYDDTVDTRKDSAAFTIVCLGGSTTEFKDKQQKGWPARVEKLLKGSLDNPDIRVYNQGRQWYTTLHTLINFQTNIRYKKPDVIIIMHTINDLLHNADFSYFSHSEFRQDYGHFYGPLNRIIPHNNLEDFIANNFAFFWYAKKREAVTQEEFPGLLPFRRNLEAIITLAQHDNIKVVLLTQPSLYKENPLPAIRPRLHMLNKEAIGAEGQWTYESALSGFIQYNEAVADLARERGVVCIDLDKEIPKSLDYFYDDVHYTDVAFDLVAEKITAGLLEHSEYLFGGFK